VAMLEERGWLLAVMAVGAVAIMATVRASGPSPQGLDAPDHQFSASRARATLERIIGSAPKPRPVGSVEHDRVRDQLVTELLSMGLSPERHSEFMCGRWGICARITNIVARLQATGGDLDARALVLAAHYDSVAASPGVSDDGAGVAAVLEVLRAVLASGKPRKHDIIVLLTDGEEIGLLGAQAFRDHHVWANDADFFINLEARGTRGASYLFEAGATEGFTVFHYARGASRPAISSGYTAIYNLLPNTTDLSEWKSRRTEAANFGYVGHVQGYHTPRDDFAHLDMRSLQHHGDNALALVRSLMTWQTLIPKHPERLPPSIYNDVMQLTVVKVSIDSARWLALLALLVLTLGGVWGALRQRQPLWRLVGAGLGWPLVVVVAAAVGFGLDKAVQVATGSPAPWWSAGERLVTMHWLVAGAIGIGLGSVMHRALGAFATWWGWWWLNAATAVAVVWLMPGFSFLWLWPALAAAVAVFAAPRWPEEPVHPAAWAVPACVLVALWLPVASGLVDAVGTSFGAVVAVPAVTCICGLFAGAVPFGRRGLLGLSGLALVGVVAALAAPVTSEDGRPSVALIGVSSTEPEVASGVYMLSPPMTLDGQALPIPDVLTAGAEERTLKSFGSFFVPRGFHAIDVPAAGAITTTVTPTGHHTAQLHIRAEQPLLNLRLVNRGARVREITLPGGPAQKVYGSVIGVRGVPGRQGLQVTLDTGLGNDVAVYETRFDLPDAVTLGNRPITEVRDADATTFQMGDLWVSGGLVQVPPSGDR